MRPASLLQQPQPLYLPRRPFRQLGDEPEFAWRLVAAELAQAVRAQRRLVGRESRLQHDACEDVLAIVRIGDADRRCLEHRWMPEQRLVDFARRDVLAALDDQLL